MRKPEEVEIVPSGDPLVPVRGERIDIAPAYSAHKAGMDEIWMRRDAARRLQEAAHLLPPGISLLLWDGWRPLSLQEELWQEYSAKLEADGWSGESLVEETRKYVSPPDRNAPHATGGTIDLSLSRHGEPLDMGGGFDELSQRSQTYFHPPDSPPGKNRKLLLAVMTHVGFSNYPEEWWHFDLGNQWHHARVGGPARYGFVGELP